jgi:amino acid transporter/mannitol/fructose-specific phosphotransferase system IIA component (Ntr-type)
MAKRLKRRLGFLDVFSIATGAMISSGLFVLPAVVYLKAGPSILLSYFIAALLVVPAMLSKAELATAMPKSGGSYFFVHRSLGALFGTFAGLASWFSLSLKSVFALVGIGIFLAPLVPMLPGYMVKLIAIAFALLFTVLNILSVKESGRFQVVLVLSLLAILLMYIAAGIRLVDAQHYSPFAPEGWPAVFTVTGMIFVSFGGLTKIAAVAEEINKPQRTIPRSMFASFMVVSVVYLLAIFVTVGILGRGGFENTLVPLSTAAATFGGRTGFLVLSIAAMLAFITTGNAGLLASSRNPLAMAKDNLLPAFFARVNVRLKTPIVAILFTAAFMIAVIVFLDLENLIKVASTMKLLLFAFVNLSVILMRESKIVSYKPSFRSPLYPVLQIGGTVVYFLLIIEMGLIPLLMTGAFFAASLLWYFLYSRSRNRRESALLHVVERITNRELRGDSLSQELKEILIERDEIVEDRFDKIIKSAEIVDFRESVNKEGLFQVLAEIFARKFNSDPAEIKRLLVAREAESTTVIHPGLAIPHIVVDGKERFEIVVVRSREGIDFGADKDPVKVVFALAGTRDERNFHLQALMAIAQIVQNPEFLSTWPHLRNAEELRNQILLAQRVRKASV